MTGTLGKALGGASGGYTSGRKEITDLLRQRNAAFLARYRPDALGPELSSKTCVYEGTSWPIWRSAARVATPSALSLSVGR